MATIHPILQQVLSASSIAYRELLKTHIARLIDLDAGFDFDQIEQPTTSTCQHTPTSIVSGIFGAPLTHEGICCMYQLIEHICQPRNLMTEGIFRISGNKCRQDEMIEVINSQWPVMVYIDPDRFSVHDCASVLKKFVSLLPQPPLTEALADLFLAASKLPEQAKRLDAFRLLVLLLPAANRSFLFDLLTMFSKVASHCQQNKMTVQNIATVFAPLFFRIDDTETIPECIRCITFMTENVGKLFEPPAKLVADATQYLANRRRIHNNEPMASSANLSAIPAAKLCATSNYSVKDYTAMQLAELQAQMESMARSSPAVKKKWLNRFNQNKDGTPNKLSRDKRQQELVRQAIKQSAQKKKAAAAAHNNLKLSKLSAAIKGKLMTSKKMTRPEEPVVNSSLSPISLQPVTAVTINEPIDSPPPPIPPRTHIPAPSHSFPFAPLPPWSNRDNIRSVRNRRCRSFGGVKRNRSYSTAITRNARSNSRSSMWKIEVIDT